MAKKNEIVEVSFDSQLAAYGEDGIFKVNPENANWAKSQENTIEQSEKAIENDETSIQDAEQAIKTNAKHQHEAFRRLKVAKFENWSKKFGAIDKGNIVKGLKLMLTSGKSVRSQKSVYESYCTKKAKLQVKIEKTKFDLKKQTEKKEEATTHLTNYQKLVQERFQAYTNVVALKKMLDGKKELLHTLPDNVKNQILSFFNEIKKGFIVDIRVPVDQMPLVQKANNITVSLGANTRRKLLETREHVTDELADRAEQYQLHGNQFHQLTATDPEPSR